MCLSSRQQGMVDHKRGFNTHGLFTLQTRTPSSIRYPITHPQTVTECYHFTMLFAYFCFVVFFCCFFFCSFWKEDLQTFLMQPLRPTLLSHSQHKSPDPLLCMRLESRFLLIFRFSQAQTTDWLASASALCVVTMDTIT